MPAFRFLHASDFHLERPPGGLTEIADHLREVLIEAPYRASERVFEAALAHEVDFVVLAGDIVDPRRAGPRGILFLREQFNRLAERNIDIYWAGGSIDRVYDWPAAVGWPPNVHICPVDRPVRFTVAKRSQPLCEIVGQSLASGGEIDDDAFDAGLSNAENRQFVIGLAYGDFDDALLRGRRIDYWALGGQHEPTLPDDTPPLIHYPGSPQGRSRAEAGPHGCTLVHVIEPGEIRTAPVVTDVVRYCDERVALPAAAPSATTGELEQLLRERTQSLADSNPNVTLLVSFTLDGGQSLSLSDRLGLPLPAIAGVLRGEFGYRTSPVWLDRIDLPPPPPLNEKWFGQQTLLSDFLQAARRQQLSGDPVGLNRYLPGGDWRAPVSELLQLNEKTLTATALEEAAALGASLLYPAEARR